MINVIPKPNKVSLSQGCFVINADTTVLCAKRFSSVLDTINQHLQSTKGFILKSADDKNADITIIFDKDIAKEGYLLDIKTDQLTIKAQDKGGVLYAYQTIRQMAKIDFSKEKDIKLPAVMVEDAPRFGWRGLMLDESRHFFGKEEVKRLLDNMALNKLNVFHWHLTDDQGWRIEIKKYPLLTEIGSVRRGTHIHGWQRSDLQKDVIWEEYGGFYTQDDIKEIVNYASERNISIVPEIDMPAHFAAAMAAYPHLGCRELKREVPYFFGGKIALDQGIKDWNRSACAGKETTYQFIFDIIDEIAELFPYPYFHIGGDEAPKDEWKKCPHCTAAIKENNLADVEALQGHFNNRISAYLKKKGKRLIGWNEILNTSNLDRSTIGQYWTNYRDKHAENYINNGGEMIMSRHRSFYFDMCYAMYPLRYTYQFEPVHQGIKKESEKRVLGVEGAVWTEWIREREKLDLNIYPRMQALAEVAWTSKENRNYKDFLNRLESYKDFYRVYDINYAENSIADPRGHFKRIKDIRTWHTRDQYFEVRRNRELK